MDECILLPIYPARELPIEGVTSEILGGKVVEKADLLPYIKKRIADSQQPIALLTVGAGDIDRLVPQIAEMLRE
jgi:UDP-N-acetylmuramate--alanine ligase